MVFKLVYMGRLRVSRFRILVYSVLMAENRDVYTTEVERVLQRTAKGTAACRNSGIRAVKTGEKAVGELKDQGRKLEKVENKLDGISEATSSSHSSLNELEKSACRRFLDSICCRRCGCERLQNIRGWIGRRIRKTSNEQAAAPQGKTPTIEDEGKDTPTKSAPTESNGTPGRTLSAQTRSALTGTTLEKLDNQIDRDLDAITPIISSAEAKALEMQRVLKDEIPTLDRLKSKSEENVAQVTLQSARTANLCN